MRILILTFYFRPDLSAGSFRATALVDELSRRLKGQGSIDVMTTRPNRYASFRATMQEDETPDNVRVNRFDLPVHKGGMVDQSRAFASYALAVRRETTGATYDVVFATSSRLMTAVLGATIAKSVNAPLYLDVRDIFPDTLNDVFGNNPMRSVLPLLRGLERWTINAATRVNLVSPGFLEYFRAIRSDLDFRTYTNGIDEEFLGIDFSNDTRKDQPTILYAGNIGEGQGLERIVPAAAKELGGRFRFKIVGDGGRKEHLVQMLNGVPNVCVEGPVPRSELMSHYRSADVLFLHLNDYAAFEKVLPSKVFEYAATGKPILAGVGGYARQFIEEHVSNAVVFDPCQSEQLVESLRSLDLSFSPRDSFIRRFRRRAIIDELADDLLALAGSQRPCPL